MTLASTLFAAGLSSPAALALAVLALVGACVLAPGVGPHRPFAPVFVRARRPVQRRPQDDR